MKNLAGDHNCDREIGQELRRSLIPSFYYDGKLGEVPSRMLGKLGPFEFRRAWYYWAVRGPLPLAIALELYADPIGRTDVRVSGHCGCPPPEAPWVKWYTAKGEVVEETKQQAAYEALLARHPEWLRTCQPIVWHDDPASIGATPHVTSYHIDTEVGLRLFCDAVRKHGLDKIERPVWWHED